MKNKVVAGVLALTFGGIGVHQFYLGNTTKGIFYIVFFWTFIPTILSIIDAIKVLSMSDRTFDEKYNWKYLDDSYHDSDYDRRRYEEESSRKQYIDRRRATSTGTQKTNTANQSVDDWRRERAMQKQQKFTQSTTHQNPYRESGVRKFKAYDFEGAVIEFEKALDIEPQDIASHFNLACAYSILEEKEEAFFHLDRAVKYGFKDLTRIATHDSLAFLRIQVEYLDFQRNGYQLVERKVNSENNLNESGNLLDQLQKLAELRDKGLLTEEEFSIQKRRILD